LEIKDLRVLSALDLNEKAGHHPGLVVGLERNGVNKARQKQQNRSHGLLSSHQPQQQLNWFSAGFQVAKQKTDNSGHAQL